MSSPKKKVRAGEEEKGPLSVFMAMPVFDDVSRFVPEGSLVMLVSSAFNLLCTGIKSIFSGARVRPIPEVSFSKVLGLGWEMPSHDALMYPLEGGVNQVYGLGQRHFLKFVTELGEVELPRVPRDTYGPDHLFELHMALNRSGVRVHEKANDLLQDSLRFIMALKSVGEGRVYTPDGMDPLEEMAEVKDVSLEAAFTFAFGDQFRWYLEVDGSNEAVAKKWEVSELLGEHVFSYEKDCAIPEEKRIKEKDRTFKRVLELICKTVSSFVVPVQGCLQDPVVLLRVLLGEYGHDIGGLCEKARMCLEDRDKLHELGLWRMRVVDELELDGLMLGLVVAAMSKRAGTKADCVLVTHLDVEASFGEEAKVVERGEDYKLVEFCGLRFFIKASLGEKEASEGHRVYNRKAVEKAHRVYWDWFVESLRGIEKRWA